MKYCRECGASIADNVYFIQYSDKTVAHYHCHKIRVKVILFKPSGKYYTEEEWEVPADATGPYDMDKSPDFRRIEGGAVLIDTQEPWGYPHLLFPSEFAL